MRKLIFGINTTLDGCCDHTKGNANEEVHEYFTQLLREADVLLYGRKTYELMVPFWPDVAKNPSSPTTALDDFAKAFDAVNKIVVVSKTLEKAEGNKTAIIRTNLREEILKLKQEEGKAIVTGGVDVPSQLLQLGLIDEYHVVVHPVIAGEGRRLFDGINLPEQSQLKLAGSKVFKSGHVALRYMKG
ncbi:dihydrofolate reductase family protein [Flavobacterium sp. DGU11]|uniref:Dihydrofolate reductase family protein n=1 Tax=Flavobacterium arundinis TaxID=3139143 RepID=A0ABU9HU11_9FLAO